MKPRSLAVLFLLAIGSYGSLAYLFPRFNPVGRWHYNLDRAAAIQAAKPVASERHVDVSGWDSYVTAAFQNAADYYLLRNPRSEAASLLSTLTTSVLFIEPGSDRRFRVDLNRDGRLTGFTYSDSAKDVPGKLPEPPEPAETAGRIADEALRQAAGSESAQFSLISKADEGKDGVRYTWERSFDENNLKLRISALVRGGIVADLSSKPEFSTRYTEELRALQSAAGAMRVVSGGLFLIAVLAAIVFYMVGLTRKEINHKEGFVLVTALILLFILTTTLGGALDNQRAGNLNVSITGISGSNALIQKVVFWLSIVLTVGGAPFVALMVWGAGRIRYTQVFPEQAASLSLLLKGKVLSRPVGASIMSGLLLGGVLSAVPYLVLATGLFPRVEAVPTGVQRLVAAAPALASLDRPINFSFLALFAFSLPVLAAYIRKPRVYQVLGLSVGWLWLVADPYRGVGTASAVASAILVGIAYVIVRQFDFLTLMSAAAAADFAVKTASLLIQPSPSLRESGFRALGAFGVVVAAAAVVAWKGREIASFNRISGRQSIVPQVLGKAERERLKAEFEVAQRAQRQMLPASPPAVPGLTISAVCRPAREVGGDLYDFLPLPDGRLGIIVADVSGKGVPAALYMTLTKGLLLSVSEDRSNPGEILQEVNRHLYQACQRKVFVTLFLGAIDQDTRMFTYCRAGHNPPVLRRSVEGTTRLLQPQGLGLGLNKGKLFDRSLAEESIQLLPQDRLFFYSDGITEAMNSSVEEYGEERLLAAIARTDGLNAEESRDVVLEDVGAFLGPIAPQDDMTLVVVEVV